MVLGLLVILQVSWPDPFFFHLCPAPRRIFLSLAFLMVVFSLGFISGRVQCRRREGDIPCFSTQPLADVASFLKHSSLGTEILQGCPLMRLQKLNSFPTLIGWQWCDNGFLPLLSLGASSSLVWCSRLCTCSRIVPSLTIFIWPFRGKFCFLPDPDFHKDYKRKFGCHVFTRYLTMGKLLNFS